MKKAEFEQKIFDLCKPMAIEIVKDTHVLSDIFNSWEFTDYGYNYGYMTIFVMNYSGWSDRVMFHVEWNSSKSIIKITDSHYFKA